MNFLAELKRRNVIRMAGLYLVGAWLIVQVAETLLPIFGTPDWVLKALVVLLAIGFVPALVFSWIFELTPEGLKRDNEVSCERSIPWQTAVRMDRLILVGLVVVIALVVGDWLTRETAPIPNSAEAKPVATAASATPRLAVLPLANFSPDPDNAFFADGLHDDLLTALSRMEGVDVISRTTMQTFKDSKLKLAEIARDVGATQVLEGSVRRDATKVRLTVQLIDAANDKHLWAETFDRPLSESLSLQNEVAQGVARALKVVLGGGAMDAPPTTIPAAYDLYLKARLTIDPDERYKLLDSALTLDPQFTQARIERAMASGYRIWANESLSAQLAPQMRDDIDRARRETPQSGAVEVAEAYFLYYVEREYQRALAQVERALTLDPNDGRGIEVRVNLLRRLGHREAAFAMSRRGLDIDPENPRSTQQLADLLEFYGQSREAIELLDAAIGRLPRELTRRLRMDRMEYVMGLTGVRPSREQVEAIQPGFVDSADGMLSPFSQRFWGQPSAEHLQQMLALPDQWCSGDPCAVWIAREAQYLGDTVQLEHSLDEAARLYASRDQSALQSPSTILVHAMFLALRGEREQPVREVEKVLGWVKSKNDHVDISWGTPLAATVLAAAGETGRAMELLEQQHDVKRRADATIYLDPYMHRWMQDEPRFAEWLKQVEARFEAL